MAISRECKHSFQIVQALFGKSASTVVCSDNKSTKSGAMGWYRGLTTVLFSTTDDTDFTDDISC